MDRKQRFVLLAIVAFQFPTLVATTADDPMLREAAAAVERVASGSLRGVEHDTALISAALGCEEDLSLRAISLSADGRAEVRAVIAAALEGATIPCPRATAALTNMLGDPDSRVRLNAALSLAMRSEPAPQAATALGAIVVAEDDDLSVRLAAAFAKSRIASLTPTERGVVNRLAQEGLVELGRRVRSGERVDKLAPSIAGAAPDVAKAALPALTELALGKNDESSLEARHALIAFGNWAPSLANAAGESFDSDETHLRALGFLGVAAPSVLEHLVSALQADSITTRAAAAWALADLRPQSPTALEQLRGMMLGAEPSLREPAGAAIVSIDPTEFDALLPRLTSLDPAVAERLKIRRAVGVLSR